MLARACGQLRVQREGRHRAGRVVRIAHPEERDLVPGVERLEIRQPAVLLRERHPDDVAVREERAALVYRVRRFRDRDEPLVPERHLGEREDRLLGSERRHDLCGGIDRDPEAASDPGADGLAQLRQAGRPRVRRDGLDRRCERVPDEPRRDLARVADPEVDQLDAARLRLGLPVVEARERVLSELGEHR